LIQPVACKVLVVDKEPRVRLPLKERLVREGFVVVEATDAAAAAALLEREALDLVLVDVARPDVGARILRGIHERTPDVPVVVLAPAAPLQTLELGAADYVAPPEDLDAIALTVKRALDTAQLRRVLGVHVADHKARYGVENLIGHSKAMQAVRSLIAKVSTSQRATVLLRGESGTGKDVVARAIHAESARAAMPYVNITCTALQDTLLESELFGHEKGAFTDAKVQKKGLLELAQGGTVLLDEIGDMSPVLQAKLLRVLEEKTFRRVGGTQDIRLDVRIVAATHVNLEELIEAKKFREDLYYRINAITIDVPALRERREDVAPLTAHFLKHFARELGKELNGITDEAIEKLRAYGWPGNVRELRNVLERAVLLGPDPVIQADDIVLGRRQVAAASSDARVFSLPEGGLDLAALDRDLVVQALARATGNQTKAAALLGITRDQYHYRLQKYGLLTGAS